MRTVVKFFVNGLERMTGITPRILSCIFTFLGIISIPVSLYGIKFMGISSSFGEWRNIGNCIVVIVEAYYFFNLIYITNKAHWRWNQFMEGDLYTVPNTGVIPDPSRWKWFPTHVFVIATVCVSPRLDEILFLLLPTWFFWPALVVSGIEPCHKATVEGQNKRLSKNFGTAIGSFFLYVCIFHIVKANADFKLGVLIFVVYAVIAGVTIRLLLKPTKLK